MSRLNVCVFFLLLLPSFNLIDVSLAWPNAFTPEILHSNELSDHIILSLKKAFFTNTIPTVIPIVNEFLENLTVPAQHTDWVDVDEIHFTRLKVENASLNMSSPNHFSVSIQNVSLVIPNTGFVVRAPLLTCDGKVSANVNISKANMVLDAHRLANESLRIKVMEITIDWKNIKTHHTLEGSACGLMEKLIEALLGNVDTLITKTMQKEVPAKAGPLVEDKAGNFFDSLPLLFTKDLDITLERMISEIKLNSKKQDNNNQLVKDLYLTEPYLPQTDLGLIFSEITINDFVRYLHSIGVLNQTISLLPEYNSSLIESIYPDVYKLCRNCSFSINVVSRIPPLVQLDSNQSSIVHVTNSFFGLDMISQSGTVIPVIETLVNFTGGVKDIAFTENERLIFYLTRVNITLEILKTNIHPIDGTELFEKLSWFLNDIFIPLFNVQFTGIMLPAQISKPMLNISSKIVFTGFNVKQVT
ncbi:hypothetical protein LSM04_005358 [Trypanosoma melophagium]|uniref:uncharacterized protein n=1 Tax=Trypanosoma melophagium TaxID=715481 RepID=UPI00351A1858|nr:hypothetical protein LSM04_005358 [Trypanosoma melophagium]